MPSLPRLSFHRFAVLLATALATGVTPAIASDSFVPPVNLLRLPAIQKSGFYTYYALGGGPGSKIIHPPFTLTFYPGDPHGKNHSARDGEFVDEGIVATAISFANGELTDGDTSGYVGGWVQVTADGYFSILFDLGAPFEISAINLIYTDTDGARWATRPHAQRTYTATALSPSGMAHTQFKLFSSATTSMNTHQSDLIIAPSNLQTEPVVARYVNLELMVNTNPSGSSGGGMLHEVQILGPAPAPQP